MASLTIQPAPNAPTQASDQPATSETSSEATFSTVYHALLAPPIRLPDRQLEAALVVSESEPEAQSDESGVSEDAPDAQEPREAPDPESIVADTMRAAAATSLAAQTRVSVSSLNDFMMQADRATLEARGVRVRSPGNPDATPAHLRSPEPGAGQQGGASGAGSSGGGGTGAQNGAGGSGTPESPTNVKDSAGTNAESGRGARSDGSANPGGSAERTQQQQAGSAALAGLATRLSGRVPIVAPAPVPAAPVAAPTAASSGAARATGGISAPAGSERSAPSGRAVRVTPEQRANVEQQIARGIGAIARQRGGVVTLRLNPETLGSVDVRVAMRGGAVEATFEAQNDSARALLESSLDRLRESLEARGVRVDRLDVRPATTVVEPGRSGESRHSEDPRSRRRGRSDRGPSEDGPRESDPVRFGLELGLDTIG